jgi:hypothetical protein
MLSSGDDVRPKWTRSDITESLARWFRDHAVRRIDHRWGMTGVDTSENWLDLYADGQKSPKRVDRLPSCVRFTPAHHFKLLQLDEYVAKEVDAIDAWDKQHARDIAELKRLQRKLYGAPAD